MFHDENSLGVYRTKTLNMAVFVAKNKLLDNYSEIEFQVEAEIILI